jgi:hypothetical protein
MQGAWRIGPGWLVLCPSKRSGVLVAWKKVMAMLVPLALLEGGLTEDSVAFAVVVEEEEEEAIRGTPEPGRSIGSQHFFMILRTGGSRLRTRTPRASRHS